MEVFGLGIKIREEGAATVEAALAKLQKQFAATSRSATTFAKAIGKIGESAVVLTKVTADLDATARAATRLNVVQSTTSASAGNIAKQFAATALSITGVTLALRSLIQTSDQMMLLEGRIGLVAQGTDNLRSLQDRLFESAQKTRASYADTSELYARVARNADQLGFSQAQLLQFSELTQMSIRTSGINAIEASRGMIQLSQALASGVLRGDEFRAVMEQMPGTARAIADGLNVPIGKLREMAYNGELTAELVMNAILKMDSRIRADFEKLPVTISDGFTRIRNAFQRAIVDANQTTGATNALGSALSRLALDIEAPLVKAFTTIGDAAKMLVPLFDGLGATIKFISRNSEEIKTSLIALGGILLAAFSPQLIAAIVAAGVAIAGFATKATAALIASGPLGLVIVGLTTGFALFNRHLNKTNEELDRQLALLDALSDPKYDPARHGEFAAMAGGVDRLAPRPTTAIGNLGAKRIAEELTLQQRGLAAFLDFMTRMREKVASAIDVSDFANIERQRRENADRERQKHLDGIAKFGIDISKIPMPSLPPIKGPGLDLSETTRQFREAMYRFRNEADEALAELREQMPNIIATTIAMGIADGLTQGFAAAFAGGGIAEGFKALTASLLGGLGSMLIAFGTKALLASELMIGLKASLAAFDPSGSAAKAIGIIALGAALKGAAQAAFGGRGGARGGLPISSTGAFTGGGISALPTQQIIFGATSATTAAGMQPRSSTNVTIIGPNDPTAQRAMQELLAKANSRGRIG